MSDLVAFALAAEYQGTVEADFGEGLQEVPKFSGGVLAVGDGDFHVADQLEAGGGTIVLYQDDDVLVDLLRSYPPLVEVTAPDDAEPLSKYDRRTLADLRQLLSLRDIVGAGGSKPEAIARLEAQDVALRDGDLQLANAIAAGDVDVDVADDGLGKLTRDELDQLGADNDVDTSSAGNKDEAIEQLRAAGVRKEA